MGGQRIVIVIFFLVLVKYNVAQSKDQKFPLNEIYSSVNTRTEQGLDGRLGYGIGIRGEILDEKKINFYVGLEYNLKSLFAKTSALTHFNSVHYSSIMLGYLSLPFGIQFSYGNKLKLIIETGWFFELNSHNYGKAEVNTGGIYTGPSIGVGIKKYMNNNNAISIRLEYKHSIKDYKDIDSYKNNYLRLLLGFSFNR